MPSWDEDSLKLDINLRSIMRLLRQEALARSIPVVNDARVYQRMMMEGLDVPEAAYVGAFRGETGLEDVEVKIAGRFGVPASRVSVELAAFEEKLQVLVSSLDSMIPQGELPDADQLSAIFDVCAWAHSDWVRIHPFANGNGRTALLWANSIAMRYGLPPFIRLRPRPSLGYGEAGTKAMQGDWKATAVVFRRLFNSFLDTKPAP